MDGIDFRRPLSGGRSSLRLLGRSAACQAPRSRTRSHHRLAGERIRRRGACVSGRIGGNGARGGRRAPYRTKKLGSSKNVVEVAMKTWARDVSGRGMPDAGIGGSASHDARHGQHAVETPWNPSRPWRRMAGLRREAGRRRPAFGDPARIHRPFRHLPGMRQADGASRPTTRTRMEAPRHDAVRNADARQDAPRQLRKPQGEGHGAAMGGEEFPIHAAFRGVLVGCPPVRAEHPGCTEAAAAELVPGP